MTLLDDRSQDVQPGYGHQDYLSLNAQLNLWETDTDGNKVIPFHKDKEAARAYFLTHVNPSTWFFHSLEEKINFLIENDYYEREFIEKYDMAFIKKLYQHAYNKKFRFPTFMSAYKFYTSYALKSFDGKRYLERYEDRIAALALYVAQGNKRFAMEIVDACMGSMFQPATPTFMNAGKAQRGELVSCFLLSMEDDLNSIFRTINGAAQLSKRGGGVAVSLTNLRGKGDPIKKIQNQSSGVIPVMKLLEDTGRYVDQLGQRQGAFAAYLNAHHIDILDFLDTKRENADEAVRIKSLSLGIVVPDITFELARKGEDMYLFSPYDVHQAYGKEFAWINVSEKYREMVDNPAIRKTKVPGGARRFLQMVAEVQLESGYPYIIFEDAANRANPVGGKIIMSNLCTEIFQPSEPSLVNDDQTYAHVGKDISCNLGSFNMKKLLESKNFAKNVETAVRLLSFVSDASDIVAVPTVAAGNRRSHAIGIGQMGVQGTFGAYEMHYGDEESLDLLSAYMQAVTFHAIRSSNQIAKERKETFDGFENSKYATGEYFEKFISDEAQRLLAVKTDKVKLILLENEVDLPTREDWEELAAAVKKHGLYNQNLQAVAPTGSISYVANATPSAMPITGRSENRKEGKIGRVVQMAAEMNMHNLEYFKTAYEIPAEWSIDLYSVLGYFVDQSSSLTLHFPAGAGVKEITRAQLYAYSKGKPLTKAPDERQQMLNKFPQGEIKSLYYYRIASSIVGDLRSMDTVSASSLDECIACAL